VDAVVDPAASDEFKLGDCVWVSGVKKGIIAFIGETQFAPGVWSGILLDEPVGKNDGSVSGVRYFACRPSHGIFAKLHTLTSLPVDTLTSLPVDTLTSLPVDSGSDKVPVSADVVSKPSDAGSDAVGSSVSGSVPEQVSGSVYDGQSERDQDNNKHNTPTAASASRPTKMQAPSRRPSGLARFSRSTGTASSSNSSLSQTAATASQPQPEAAVSANVSAGNSASSLFALKVGDRVVIGGSKAGVLRYFGATHFAKGEWAGIELDEPVGKNDGSVEGKR